MGLFDSIFGSGSKAAYDVSGITNATNESNALWKQLYEQNVSANQPYLSTGTSANTRLADLLGLSDNASAAGYGTLGSTLNTSDLINDESYQFRLGEGQKALERSAAAKGSLYSPATSKALMSYGQGLASEEYGNAFNRNLQSQSALYNMLSGLSGSGQQAAGAQADYGTTYAAAKSGNDMALQQAILGSYQAKNAANTAAWNNVVNVGTKLGAAALMSDRRVKHGIKSLGLRNGYKWYEFSYKGSNKRYEGVMAQDVQRTNPDAVHDIGGILHVDYNKLGVQMREIA